MDGPWQARPFEETMEALLEAELQYGKGGHGHRGFTAAQPVDNR